MDLFEAINERYCYRGSFKDIKIPREKLAKIATCGINAPSGCNAQTTSFVIVDDPALLSHIGEVIAKTSVKTAPAVIVVISQTIEPYPGMCFEKEDYSAATQNILLAITALGYASVWLDGVLREESRAERIADILSVPKDYHVQVLLPIGIPTEEGPRREKLSFEQRACFNRFQLKPLQGHS